MSAPRLIFGVPGVFAPDPGVIVEAATLDEALNQVTTADVTLVVDPPAYPADLRLSDWCGAQGVLMIQVATDDGPWQRCVAGVITTAQALLDGEQRVERVELRLRGWPAAAGAKSFASQYRFFQARSSSGIAHDLFTAAGGSVADVASGTTPERAYEVQYGESDETVVLRVLGEDDRIVVIEPEDQGTSFPAAPITLRLSIHGGLDSLPSGAGAAAHVAQRTVQPLALPGRDGVYDVMITHRRAPAGVAVAAHHPATPNIDLRSASGNGGGRASLGCGGRLRGAGRSGGLGRGGCPATSRRRGDAYLVSQCAALDRRGPWHHAARGGWRRGVVAAGGVDCVDAHVQAWISGALVVRGGGTLPVRRRAMAARTTRAAAPARIVAGRRAGCDRDARCRQAAFAAGLRGAYRRDGPHPRADPVARACARRRYG